MPDIAEDRRYAKSRNPGPHREQAMDESMLNQKRALRKKMRALRAGIPPEKRREAGHRIIEVLLSGCLPIPAPARGSVLAMYVSDGGEPDFMPCLPELIRTGIACCFPAFREDKMGFFAAADAAEFVVGAYGIYEPGPTAPPIAGKSIDIILVPGMAFDRSGARLGRGKGHYDRYLQHIDPPGRPFTVGTGYEFQIIDEVPTDAADVRMDCGITPNGIFASARMKACCSEQQEGGLYE